MSHHWWEQQQGHRWGTIAINLGAHQGAELLPDQLFSTFKKKTKTNTEILKKNNLSGSGGFLVDS